VRLVTHARVYLVVPVVNTRLRQLLLTPNNSSSPCRRYRESMTEPTKFHPDSKTVNTLRIQTQLKSRYTVFDASGRLPFDVVFGLRRKSDSDPRDVSFQVTRSFLDVPYALANGLLSLHELRSSDTGPNEHIEVDLSRLSKTFADQESTVEYIVLPSKSNRTAERGQLGFTEYRYRVEPGSLLASMFEPSHKYSIGLANRDLDMQCWINGDHVPSPVAQTNPSSAAESAVENCKLVSSAHGGFAVFRAVEHLTWPPTIETRIHLLSSQRTEGPSSDEASGPLLQVTVTNTGSHSISIQTRGQQRFVSSWRPFQPESDDGLNAGSKPCILDPSSTTGNLKVLDAATRSVVRDAFKGSARGPPPVRRGLRQGVNEPRVLHPGVAVTGELEVDTLWRGLKDGRYLIRLKPKGCWWHPGDIKSRPDDEGKVPKHFNTPHQTPIVLESKDEVEFEMRNGKI
jgi:hypothetical protein